MGLLTGPDAVRARNGSDVVFVLSKRREPRRFDKVNRNDYFSPITPFPCYYVPLNRSIPTRVLYTRAVVVVCRRRGLYISDIPLHDATRDLVLMSEQFEADYKLTRDLEFLTDKLQQTYRELESEKQKTDRYLYS